LTARPGVARQSAGDSLALCYAPPMGMILFSLLGLLFALGVFYAARRLLKKIEAGEDD